MRRWQPRTLAGTFLVLQLAVVARLGTPLPQLAAELGAIVHQVCGPVAVEVTVCDVEVGTGAAVEAAAR